MNRSMADSCNAASSGSATARRAVPGCESGWPVAGSIEHARPRSREMAAVVAWHWSRRLRDAHVGSFVGDLQFEAVEHDQRHPRRMVGRKVQRDRRPVMVAVQQTALDAERGKSGRQCRGVIGHFPLSNRQRGGIAAARQVRRDDREVLPQPLHARGMLQRRAGRIVQHDQQRAPSTAAVVDLAVRDRNEALAPAQSCSPSNGPTQSGIFRLVFPELTP